MSAPGHPGEPYFAALAEHLGRRLPALRVHQGHEQEVRFLVDLLGLGRGARVLDVGCEPRRHAIALARAGLAVTGVDVSRRFLDIAADGARAAGVGASFFEVDARRMPFENEFDAVISICQEAFGLMGRDDALVLKGMADAARPGTAVVLTACSTYFEVARARPEASFDQDAGGWLHERATLRGEDGTERAADLWTSVYTARELRLLAIGCGLVPESVWSIEPGSFARRPVDLEHPELMLVARRPRSA